MIQHFFLLILLFSQSVYAQSMSESGDQKRIAKFNAIVREYEEEIKRDPKNLKLILAVAEVYYSLKEYTKAIAYYQQALDLDSKNVKIKTALALAYLNNNELESSEQLFQQVLKAEPENLEALSGLGRIAALSHQFDQAESFFQKVLAKDPEHFATLFYLAELRIEQKRFADAEAIATKLLKIDPHAAWVKQALKRAKIGPILEKAETSGDMEPAITELRQQLSEDSDNIEAYLALARMYSQTGNNAAAIELLNEAKKRYPNENSVRLALGFAYLAKGDLLLAEFTFENALQSGLGQAEALAGLGRVAALKGKTRKAERLFQQALDINPVNSLALSYLAELRMKQKRYEEAEQLLQRILQLNPRAVWAKQAIDEARIAPQLEAIAREERLNHFAIAEKMFENLLNEFPENISNYLQFAKFYSKQKRYPQAIDILMKGLRTQPDALPLYIALGYNYLSNGELRLSQQSFNYVLEHDPANTEAMTGMGRIYALIGDVQSAENLYRSALQINPQEVTALSYLADLAMEEKNYTEAQQLAKQILKITPKAKWAEDMLIRAKYGAVFDEIDILESVGLEQEAMARLQVIQMLAPQSEDAYLELGRIYTNQRRYQDAVELYKTGLAINPSANQLRVNLGLTYLNMNRLKQAKELLRSAYQQDSKNADAIAGLGRIAALSGDLKQAKKLYETALNINPDNLLALSFLADLLMKEKKFAQAEKAYAKVLLIDPNARWAKIGQENAQHGPELLEGEEKEKSKDFSEAEAVYSKLISKAPENPEYYIKLGRLYLSQSRFQEAITLYKKGLKVIPDSQDLALALGFAYLAKGDLQTGKMIFESVLAQNPENAEAIAGIGRYEELSGSKRSAFTLYQKALEINPDNITALAYLSKLMIEMGLYDEAQKIYMRIGVLQPSAEWVPQAILDAKHGRLLAAIKAKESAEDFQGAELLWQQLIKEEPSSSVYYLRMGLFYHKIKEYEKAIDTLLRGIQIDPSDSTELYAALGLVYLSLKKYDKARIAFKRSLERDAKNPDALAGLGVLATISEKYKEAEQLIQSALAIDPERIAALSAYGEWLMKEKRYKEAVKIYEKLLALRPKDRWIKTALEVAISGPELDEISEMIAQEQYSEAAETYLRLLEKFPDNPQYAFGLGQMYMRLKEYGKSIEALSAGLEKNPAENELRVALGYAYFFNNDFGDAREQLSQALERDKKNAEALAGLGRLNALEDDLETAEVLYTKALEIEPKNQSAITFYADLLMKQRRFSEAQALFEKLKQLLPDAVWVQRAWQDAVDGPATIIANNLADREEFELAAAIYRDLVAASPNDPARFLALGQMYVNLQMYCCAIDIYMQGLMIDPDAWYLWRAIGFAYIYLEEFEASRCIFEYLLEQDPNDAESWAGLGRIEAVNGSICLAEEFYSNALAISPRNLTALSFLSELQQNEEYNFSALNTYNTIYEIADSNRIDCCEALPKWVRRGYNKALNLTYPTLNIGAAYHEEDQWDPNLHRWSAEYLVYGGKALFNYPIQDDLTVWGSFADQFYDLKDLITRKHIYSFDVQRFHVGARWVCSPCLFVDAKAGISDYSAYHDSTFRMRRGTIAEPSILFTYHLPTEKGTFGLLTNSDLVARNFHRNVAKMVGYYNLLGTYEWKIIKRGWIGFEANAYWFNDFVNNNSQRVLGWFQWRPPCYSDNILFRYFVKCQTFAHNIPDYYTYQPQVVNQLQVTLEKFWRVCWADTFYTSLSYGHGWQDTRTRFAEIIVVDPFPVRPPFTWDRRQFDIVFGTLIYKRDQLQVTFAADYYRDTEKYTIWTVGVDVGWRF